MKRKSINVAIIGATAIFSLFFAACSKVKETPAADLNAGQKGKARTESFSGIGSGSVYYDLSDTRDQIVPFDYYSTGKAKQLICYRPGTGIVWIFDNTAAANASPNFERVFQTSSGIGSAPNNYNLNDSRDQIVPYDYNGTGNLDHIICYRPGTGNFWIFRNNNGVFSLVHKTTSGVGSGSTYYNLNDSRDKIVPFDFYHTGKAKQLVCYRPGAGICWIMDNTAAPGAAPNFVPVYQTWTGIGQPSDFPYNLNDSRDLIIPFDIKGTGFKDGLVCYRPGTGAIYNMTHEANSSYTFYTRFYSHTGVYNWENEHYDLSSSADRIIPYDYFSNGQTTNLVCYRPGAGICWMFTQWPLIGHTNIGGYGNISYQSFNGLSNYDLVNGNDKIFAYDFNGTGKIDHLVCYRPGSGIFWIFNNSLAQIY